MLGKPPQNLVKWAVFVLIIGCLVCVFVAFPIEEWLRTQLDGFEALGPIGYLWFVLMYIIATVAGFPASILTLGAGAVYGVFIGTIWVIVGATLGATSAFLVGRYLARNVIVRRVSNNARFKAVDEAVGRAGFKIVFLTRLSPVFPFVLLNYAFGITNVKLWDYVAASFLGMIPGTILYVYLGSLAATVATGELPDSPARKVFIFAGLLVTIIVSVYVARIARRALRDVERNHS